MMYEKEKNMVMYEYIACLFDKLAEEHEMVKENLPEIKKHIEKQLNVNAVHVAYDAF